MIALTKKEKKIYRDQEICYICQKGFSTGDGGNKNTIK